MGGNRIGRARCRDLDLEAELVEKTPFRHDAKVVVSSGRCVCHDDDFGARHEALDRGGRISRLGERVAAVENDDGGGERRRDGTRVLVASHDRHLVPEAGDQEAHQSEESTIVGTNEDTYRATRNWACDSTPPEEGGE